MGIFKSKNNKTDKKEIEKNKANEPENMEENPQDNSNESDPIKILQKDDPDAYAFYEMHKKASEVRKNNGNLQPPKHRAKKIFEAFKKKFPDFCEKFNFKKSGDIINDINNLNARKELKKGTCTKTLRGYAEKRREDLNKTKEKDSTPSSTQEVENNAPKASNTKDSNRNITDKNKESNKKHESTKNKNPSQSRNNQKTQPENNDIMAELKKIQTKIQKISSTIDSHDSKISQLASAGEVAKLHSRLDEQQNKINELSKTKQNDAQRFKNLSNKLDKLDTISNKLKNFEEEIFSQLEVELPKQIKAIEDPFDQIRGKFEIIDDIKETLQQKGVSIRQELLPFNEDDEVITLLSQYAIKIIEQLSIAARQYAANRKNITDTRKNEEEFQQKLKDTEEESFDEGKREGQRCLVSKIIDDIGKENLDTLFNSSEGNDTIIKTMLREQGLSSSEKYHDGESITITEENRIKHEKYVKFSGFGDFRITTSCFILNEKVIKKATLQKQEPCNENEENQENNQTQAQSKE